MNAAEIAGANDFITAKADGKFSDRRSAGRAVRVPLRGNAPSVRLRRATDCF